MTQPPPRTVVELPRFVEDAARLMSEEERGAFIIHIATNPEAGDVMPGTGGFRKVRWGIGGRRKSGGARISAAERNALRSLAPRLLAAFRKGH